MPVLRRCWLSEPGISIPAPMPRAQFLRLTAPISSSCLAILLFPCPCSSLSQLLFPRLFSDPLELRALGHRPFSVCAAHNFKEPCCFRPGGGAGALCRRRSPGRLEECHRRMRNRWRGPVWRSLVRGVVRGGGPGKAGIWWSYAFVCFILLWLYWCS